MADLSQVEHLLRNLRTSVSQSTGGDFIVTYNDIGLTLPNTDVDRYLTSKATMERPVPPAICLPGFFEQAVEVQGHGPATYRLFREREEIALEDSAHGRGVILSPASTLFALAQLDAEEMPVDLRRIIHMSRMRIRNRSNGEDDQGVPFNAIFGRILTVKVATSPEDSFARSCRRLQAIAEASLFHVTYCQGIGFSLSLSWERAYYRLGLRRDAVVQFPLRTYTSELLAYYHLAFGSDSLILAYLALYKVLEYFFTSSSDKVLHQKITEKLIEPDFSHAKPNKLQELAKVIRQHDTKLDERRLLRTVLEHYFDADELREWVTAFDADNEAYLTSERDVFAERLRIDVSDDQVFSTVANRIYHIRNALVHHKEGEVSRFIPFSGQEAILYREIPLLIYLSEQVIMKTGKDIQ
jgi:hypothetical protein